MANTALSESRPALASSTPPSDFSTLKIPKRILIATDTYAGQVNGVEMSLQKTKQILEERGCDVALLQTDKSSSYALPFRREIRVQVPNRNKISRFIDSFDPDAIHVATESTIGLQVRGICAKNGYRFTTSFHTLWPKYLKEHMWVPESLSWKLLRWFHGAGACTMTRSDSMVKTLQSHGFLNLARWSGGVDTEVFKPSNSLDSELAKLPRPILLYVGRVSREKNIEAFLNLPIKMGSKVVVGDGAQLTSLRKAYPEVCFMGALPQHELPKIYSSGDVFVFPSTTDTFGCVIVEALACGLPVAALPVTGPKDIITSPELGALSDNLEEAVYLALNKRSDDAKESRVKFAKKFGAGKCVDEFIQNLRPIDRLRAVPVLPFHRGAQ